MKKKKQPVISSYFPELNKDNLQKAGARSIEMIKKIYSGKRRKVKIISSILLGAIIISIAVQSIITSRRKSDTLDLNMSLAGESSSIETYRVSMKEVADEIDILGQIVFREKINVSSKINGRLKKIYVKEGDRVRAGQLIAEMERLPLQISLKQQQSELMIAKRSYDLTRAKYENALKGIEIKLKTIEKAEADVNDKKVTYQNMDRILKNKRILHQAGGLSDSEIKSLMAQHTTVYTKYELAKKDYAIQRVGYRDEDILAEGMKVPKSKKDKLDTLKKINTKIERAELEAAKARIDQARTNIESTQILLKETYIKSPINGVVASKNIEAGEMVKEDSTIATILNISSVFVAMNVNEKDFMKIKPDQQVTFTVDAIGDEKFTAMIKRITPVLDMKTRTVEVKAEITNPGYRLLPGMFARASIEVGDKEKKLIIPKSSIVKKEGNVAEIYIVKKGLAFKQKVALGMEYRTFVEVLKGLKEKDIVISKGVSIVYPEMKISLNKSAPKK